MVEESVVVEGFVDVLYLFCFNVNFITQVILAPNIFVGVLC